MNIESVENGYIVVELHFSEAQVFGRALRHVAETDFSEEHRLLIEAWSSTFDAAAFAGYLQMATHRTEHFTLGMYQSGDKLRDVRAGCEQEGAEDAAATTAA